LQINQPLRGTCGAIYERKPREVRDVMNGKRKESENYVFPQYEKSIEMSLLPIITLVRRQSYNVKVKLKLRIVDAKQPRNKCKPCLVFVFHIIVNRIFATKE
jgi:hypothetical protein